MCSKSLLAEPHQAPEARRIDASAALPPGGFWRMLVETGLP
jgi:hypothetical protein